MAKPSKYKASFCSELIKHQAQGLAFASFAGVAGVNRDTLYEWLKAHADFREAKSLAESKCFLWWDKVCRDGARDKDVNTGLVAINMRNRFGWLDKKQTEDESLTETPLSKNTEEDLNRVLRLADERRR